MGNNNVVFFSFVCNFIPESTLLLPIFAAIMLLFLNVKIILKITMGGLFWYFL